VTHRPSAYDSSSAPTNLSGASAADLLCIYYGEDKSKGKKQDSLG